MLLEGDGGAALAAVTDDAGIELDLARALAIRRAHEPCAWAEVNAELKLHDGGAGEAEVHAYLERWGLMTPEWADHMIRFYTEATTRTYIHTYSAGRELCRSYVAGEPKRFRRLLTEQVRVRDLLEARDAGEVAADSIAWRRHLHAHPELSFREHETARFVRDTLASFGGLEIECPTPTSVVARLRCGQPGHTLALRADMDGLPIQEESGVEFSSQTNGAMHACGHDGHTAMLLAVARLLVARRAELEGEVRFLFQHAEELPPGGAAELVAAGALEGVEAVVGCHLIST